MLKVKQIITEDYGYRRYYGGGGGGDKNGGEGGRLGNIETRFITKHY